jgi:hypothetical protein
MTFRESVLTAVSAKIESRFGVDYTKVKTFDRWLSNQEKERIANEISQSIEASEKNWSEAVKKFTKILEKMSRSFENEGSR